MALLGIPPIFTDLFEFLAGLGVRVIFNEIPRQFSMPHHALGFVRTIPPLHVPLQHFLPPRRHPRRTRAAQQVEGVINYAQSFCYRQIQDIIMREKIEMPMLTLEGDRPGALDARSRLRLETFVEILQLRNKCAESESTK